MFHRLEQVSSAESVGSLAENLVEALRENPIVAKKVRSMALSEGTCWTGQHMFINTTKPPFPDAKLTPWKCNTFPIYVVWCTIYSYANK